MTAALDCEVLVVGAGPTGLMAATLLRRAGVNVRIVEQRTEATRESRAFAVQARTLELMQSIGLAETFVARGVKAPGVNIHVRGRFRGGLDFRRAEAGDTPYPYILLIPQSETEAILAADCAALGVDVERGVTVKGIAQDGEGVVTRAIGPGGEQWIRSCYVIGADGSHSVVRGQAGLAWDGDILPQRFLLADCKVEWPLDHDQFRVFLNKQRVGLFLPLDGTRLSRVMATDLSASAGDGDGTKPAPLDLTEMQAGLQAAIALPVTLSDPVWVTRYRAHHRFTDRYRSARAFVAGDAAHIHSPAGGQGMNTGLQDVANLAWKLAAVLHRGAPDTLLDSYDAERRPVGEAVVRSTGKLFAAAAGQAGWKAALRDLLVGIVLPVISRLKPFQTKAFRNASQRAIRYPVGAFVDGAGGKGPPPGARAPDAALVGGGSVFALIGGYRFTVLALSRAPVTGAQRATLDALAGPGVATAVIDDAAGGAAFDRYGVTGQAIVLVRPDGYIAWRAEGWDTEGCAAFLARFGSVEREPARVAA